MRNATFALTSDLAMLDTNVLILAERALTDGATVALSYGYRDKDGEGHAEGTLIGFAGTEGQSTSALKVETDRGPRTINTWLVTDMTVLLPCGSTVESGVFAEVRKM